MKVHVGGRRVIATAEGNGPGERARHARCGSRSTAASRRSSACTSPTTRCACSTRSKGTGAVTRVLIDSTDGDATWTTIGVNENIIEASWQALLDSIHFGLLQAEQSGAGRVVSGRADRSVRPVRSRTPGPASSRTCRRASRCRRHATGAPTGPATSVRRSPRDALLGRPGPNVGYAYTLAARAKDRLRARARRARRTTRSQWSPRSQASVPRPFGRAPVIGDIDVAIALLGYDGSADEEFVAGARAARARGRTRAIRAGARSSTRFPTHSCRERPGDAEPDIERWRAALVQRPRPARRPPADDVT